MKRKPSKMKKLIAKLGINETYTKSRKRDKKEDTHVKDIVFPAKNHNDEADLLLLPTTKTGHGYTYKYLLVIDDIWSNYFDIEPLQLKSKDSETVKDAMLKMFKRSTYIKKPKASIRTDSGPEFKGEFDK